MTTTITSKDPLNDDHYDSNDEQIADLKALVEELRVEQKGTRATAAEIERAHQLYAIGADDNIEIDDDAKTSRADNGTWVAAWVYLADDEEDEDNG